VAGEYGLWSTLLCLHRQFASCQSAAGCESSALPDFTGKCATEEGKGGDRARLAPTNALRGMEDYGLRGWISARGF